MAQKLNKQLVVALTMAGMLLTTAAGVVMVYSLPKKDPQPFVQKAQEHAARNEYEEAAKAWDQAARRARSANDSAAANEYLVKSGEMALLAGDARGAMKQWEDVILKDPQHQPAQEKIVRFFLEIADLEESTNAWSQVQTKAEKLMNMAGSGKKNFLASYALGRALLGQRNVREDNAERGRNYLIEAVQGDPGNPDYSASLASYYLGEANRKDATGQSPEARELTKQAVDTFDALIANLPSDPKVAAKAHLMRGRFFASDYLGRVYPDAEQRALADLEQAVSLAPGDVDALIGLGGYWHARKIKSLRAKAPPAETDEYRRKARETYEKAIAADPDHYAGYLQLAQLLAEDGQYTEALDIVQKRLDRGIKRDHYLGWRNRQYMAGMREQAFQLNIALYGKAIAEAGGNKAGEAILERLDRLYKESVAELGERDPRTLYMKGRLALLQEKSFEAMQALQDAQKLFPSPNLEIERMLAGIYSRTGAPGLAEESINRVLAAAPNDMPSLLLKATVLNQLNRPAEAIDVANRVLAIDPNNQDALRAKLQAAQLQRNVAMIDQVRKAITTGDPARDRFNEAMVLAMQATQGERIDNAKMQQALGILRELLKEDPANLQVLQRFVGLMGDNDANLPQVQQVIDETRAGIEGEMKRVAATQPAAPRVKQLERALANAEVIRVTIDPTLSTEEKIRRSEEVIRRNVDDPYQMNVDLFQLYRRLPERSDDAFAALKEAHKLRPTETWTIEALFQAALVKQDWALAQELIDKAMSMNLEKSGGHIYRGQLLLAQNRLPEAEREFRDGLEKVSSFPEGHAMLGRALMGQNRYDEARREFEEARRLNPQNASAVIGLAMIAAIQGDEAEKQRYLATAAQVAPDHPWVQAEVQNNQDKRDPQKGIARREQLRKQNPRDTENLLRLADLYLTANQPDAARAIFEQLIKDYPTEPRFVRGYAGFLMRRQPPETKAAQAIFARLVDSIDAADPRKKAAAQLLLAANLRIQNAQGVPDAPTVEEVDAAYLKAYEISAAPGVAIEIGNFFADTRRFQKAEEWFRTAMTTADNDASRQEHRVAARLLVQTILQTGDAARSEELTRIIDTYAQRYPEDPITLLFTAEVHVLNGHDTEAIQTYSEYVARQPDSPVGFARRALAYVRRSDLESAIRDLREVKRLNPSYGNFGSRLALAQALESTGQVDAAIAELQSLMEEQGGSIQSIQQLLALYLKLQRFDSAESLITARSQGSPDAPIWDHFRLQIAQARHDMQAAVNYAATLVTKTNHSREAVDNLLEMLLQAGRYDDVLKTVEKLPQANREDGLTQLRAAAAHAGKGRIEETLKIYREILSTPPVEFDFFSQMFGRDLLARLKDDPAGMQKLEEQLKTGDDRSSRILRAVMQIKRGQQQAAITSLRELLATLEGDSPDVQRERVFFMRALASQLYDAKQFEASRDLYKKILEIAPNDVVSLNNLAYMLMDHFQDPQAALPYARKVVDTVPDGAPDKAGVLDTLGWNLTLLGQYDEGIARLGRAVESNTQLPTIHYHLAEALYRRSEQPNTRDAQGDREQAKAAVMTAYNLIRNQRTDRENVLEKLTALGQKLGVQLDPNISAAGPGATPPAQASQ